MSSRAGATLARFAREAARRHLMASPPLSRPPDPTAALGVIRGSGASAALAARPPPLPAIPSRAWAAFASRAKSTSSAASDTVAARARMGLSPAAAANSTAGAAAVAAGIAPARPVGSILGLLRVYHDLSKFKLSAFVVSTSTAGYVLGSGETVDWAQAGWTSLGTFLCSASANTFNQVFEVKNDARMARTMRRPLPSGRCSRPHAAAFGVAAGLAGVLLLREKTNDLTARLGAFNIGLYALCYTPLKQVHWLNTWVGAVVGAVPPLMGWAAARDALEPQAMVLAAALYFWQMPHFMALAWMARDDYVRGGYRMMSHPAYDATGRRVAAVALRNAAYMLPIGVAAVACGLTTPPFAHEAALLAMPMALGAAAFHRKPSVAAARAMFYGSLAYLPAFQAMACWHRVPRVEGATIPMEVRVPARPWVWSEWSATGWQSWGDEWGETPGTAALGSSMDAVSAAPFPFLPTPTWPERCPHVAECETGERTKEGRGNGRGRGGDGR